MKLFLEIIKERTEEEEEFGFPAQEFRYEVKDEEEAKKLAEKLKEIMQEPEWKYQLHYCYHDEGKPCVVKPLK